MNELVVFETEINNFNTVTESRTFVAFVENACHSTVGDITILPLLVE